MRIEKLTEKHLKEVSKLALENYYEEKLLVPELPENVIIPELGIFAEDGLGVVAFEGDELVGFLGVYPSFEGALDMYDGKGVFSPIHAHGTK